MCINVGGVTRTRYEMHYTKSEDNFVITHEIQVYTCEYDLDDLVAIIYKYIYVYIFRL